MQQWMFLGNRRFKWPVGQRKIHLTTANITPQQISGLAGIRIIAEHN